MEIYYTVVINDHREARELANARTIDLGECARLAAMWTDISAASGRGAVYAIACVRPMGFKGHWNQAQIDEFCSLTPEEAFRRLKAFDGAIVQKQQGA